MPDKESMSTPDSSIKALQDEVQFMLGRSMLGFQQYERLIKVMMAGSALEGTSSTIASTRDGRSAELSEKTLGTLLQSYFLKEFVVHSGTNSNQEEAAETATESLAVATGLPYVRVRFQMEMEPERFEQTRQNLLALRDLRNDVVHHLLDRFDIHTASGCLAAMSYLDACHITCNKQFLQLKEWAVNMENSRELAASFVRTQMFRDFFVNGINPDGTVNWPQSGVVQALREAELACAKNAWVLLDLAIEWLRANHKDQTPKKYQCKTWKQVLARSKQFEVRVTVDPVSNCGQTWFRSKAET